MYTAILRTNGSIRNDSGKLIGFYDAEQNTLAIDGHVQTFQVTDEAHAMEVFGDNYSGGVYCGAVTHAK